jgi:predicted small secreted protein
MGKHVTKAVIILFFAATIAGCAETMKGVTKDIDQMGKNIRSYERNDVKEQETDEYIK